MSLKLCHKVQFSIVGKIMIKNHPTYRIYEIVFLQLLDHHHPSPDLPHQNLLHCTHFGDACITHRTLGHITDFHLVFGLTCVAHTQPS